MSEIIFACPDCIDGLIESKCSVCSLILEEHPLQSQLATAQERIKELEGEIGDRDVHIASIFDLVNTRCRENINAFKAVDIKEGIDQLGNHLALENYYNRGLKESLAEAGEIIEEYQFYRMGSGVNAILVCHGCGAMIKEAESTGYEDICKPDCKLNNWIKGKS